MVIPSHHLFLSSLTVSPLSVLSEAPNPRVTKWEETSCLKEVYLVPLGLELMDLMLPSVDSAMPSFRGLGLLKSCKTGRDGELKTTDLTFSFQ